MVMRIISSGPHVSVQGLSSLDSMPFGVPPGGAFDQEACTLANTLVGNKPDCKGLEVGLGELILESTGPIHFVVLGAERRMEAGNREVQLGHVHLLQRGQYLALRPGGRVFIAFAGGLLSDGENHELETEPRPAKEVHLADSLDSRAPGPFRFTWGPESESFDQKSFQDTRYEIARQLDRMGIRLEGTPLTAPSADRPSEMQVPGTIQVPPEGKPILLGPSGPTLGGYPRIGVIAEADRNRMAYLAPGQPISFQKVEREEAVQLLANSRDKLARQVQQLRLAIA